MAVVGGIILLTLLRSPTVLTSTVADQVVNTPVDVQSLIQQDLKVQEKVLNPAFERGRRSAEQEAKRLEFAAQQEEIEQALNQADMYHSRVREIPQLPIEQERQVIREAEAAAEEDPARPATPDLLAFVFSFCGGAFMGSYPAMVKLRSVREAGVHPCIFQLYKSTWACMAGWFFVLINLERGGYTFSWLGMMSAAFWVPSGICCLSAVPRIGIGTTMTLALGTSTVATFLVFWLCFDEHMKNHGSTRHPFISAPLYMVGVVAGMITLVLAMGGGGACHGEEKATTTDKEQQTLKDSKSTASTGFGARRPSLIRAVSESNGTSSYANSVGSNTILTLASGILFALCSGTCDMVANGLVNAGKKILWRHAHCDGNPLQCPPALLHQFNVFGSWMATFGTSAIIIAWCVLFTLWGIQTCQGQPRAKLHVKTMILPGNAAGMLWCVGYLFQLKALTRGGSAVMMPCNAACSLITSGLWSLFYYAETKGFYRRCIWAGAVAFTLCMIILLVHEKDMDHAKAVIARNVNTNVIMRIGATSELISFPGGILLDM